MTISQWLKQAEAQLSMAGIGTARLDALVLLEDTLKIDRATLLAEPQTELSATQRAKLAKLLRRRATHEPLAYLRGFTEFYGRQFMISPAVLEPRPESETMIDQLKGLELPVKQARIADVGAGSGALGITAQLELPHTQVDLLELDAAACAVAKINVDLFTLQIPVIKSDLLTNSGKDYDVLLCNLPYVPDGFQINEAALREPKIAIFGGPDGLDLFRRLFSQAQKRSKSPLFILTESLPPQHDGLRAIAAGAGYDLQLEDDFIQVFRQK